MTELLHWSEWYRMCALDACDHDVRGALHLYAGSRFRYYVRIYLRQTNHTEPDALIPSDAEAWHAFETLVRLRHTRQGKCYKHWLFTRAQGATGRRALDAVQSGATLLMRDVVRDRLRTETSPRHTISLDRPLPDNQPEGPALRDLLPGFDNPGLDVQQRDFDQQGARTAVELLHKGLNRRHKVSLLARMLGFSLVNQMVVAAAECSRSALCRTYHDALQSIAEKVNARFAQDDPATRAALAVATFHALKPGLLAWGRKERKLAAFFDTGRRRTKYSARVPVRKRLAKEMTP